MSKQCGYTKVSNALLEHLISLKMNGCEYSICLLVLRRSIGWHQDATTLSLQELVDLSGYAERQIRKSLIRLEQQNIICISKSGAQKTYALLPNLELDRQSLGTSNRHKSAEKRSNSAELNRHKSAEKRHKNAEHNRHKSAEKRHKNAEHNRHKSAEKESNSADVLAQKCRLYILRKENIKESIKEIEENPKKIKFSKPACEDVKTYFEKLLNRKLHDNGEHMKFLDYYNANGWMVGRNRMKDWHAAVRNWVRNSNKFYKSSANTVSSVIEKNQSNFDQWKKDLEKEILS